MKKLNILTIILSIMIIGFGISNNKHDKYLDKYSLAEISIYDNHTTYSDFVNILEQNANENNLILLNNRLYNDEISWFCIGKICDLTTNDYYSTINDNEAKKTIPIKLEYETKIFPFSKLENISIENISFTLVGNNSSFSDFINSLENDGINVKYNNTKHVQQTSRIFNISIIILILLYLITLFSRSKEYLLGKYNGLYMFEATRRIMLSNFIIISVGTFLTVSILFLICNNDNFVFFILKDLIVRFIWVYLFVVATEFCVCFHSRKQYDFKNINTQIIKISKTLTFLILVIIILLSNINVSQIGEELTYLIDKEENIPAEEFNEYYTYALTLYGNVDLDYMSSVVDPRHVKFYKETEEKFNGIVSDFQNYPTDYPIINENYLQLIGNDIKLDNKKINILVDTDNLEYDISDANEVKVIDSTYPYINSDTGLIEEYNGPIYVINSNIIDSIDPTLISVILQHNNYYLKADPKELDTIKKNLELDQNMTEFYNVNSISNDYTTKIKTEFINNITSLSFYFILTSTCLIMFIMYNYELKEKEIALRYYFGDNIFKMISIEILKLFIAILLIQLINVNIYTLSYSIILILISSIMYMLVYTKINNNKHEIIKE